MYGIARARRAADVLQRRPQSAAGGREGRRAAARRPAARSSACSRGRRSRRRPSVLAAGRLADRVQRRRVGGDVGRRRRVRRGADSGRRAEAPPAVDRRDRCGRIFADVPRVHKGAPQSDDITALVLGTARRRAMPIAGPRSRSKIDPGAHARIEKRLLILWFALAFVVWNGVYDMRMHDTVRGYCWRPRWRRPASARGVDMRPYLHRGSVDAIAFSTAWSLGVFLAGLVTMRTYRRTSPNGAMLHAAPNDASDCMHPLIYDWNSTDAPTAGRGAARRRDAARRAAVAVGADARRSTRSCASCTSSIGSASTPPTSACPAPARTSCATSNGWRARSSISG